MTLCQSLTISSVTQACPTLQPQHTRLPCSSPTPRGSSNSCPLNRWCHPIILSSVIPFSSCPQSFPASGSFQMSHFFASGGQNVGVSASASVLPMNIQDWFPSGLTGLISLQSKVLKSLLQHHSSKASILWCSAFIIVQHSHPYMTTGKTIALTRQTYVSQVMSLLFNMLSRFVIAFLSRSKHLLISWLQTPSAVILETPKIKSVIVSIVFHLFIMKWQIPDWYSWREKAFFKISYYKIHTKILQNIWKIAKIIQYFWKASRKDAGCLNIRLQDTCSFTLGETSAEPSIFKVLMGIRA